jgi:hypothetical protein
LEQLFSSVGIGSIDISVHEGSARFPSLEEFVRTEIQAWLLAQSVDESGLDAMIADAGTRFSGYIGEDGSMEFPIAAKVVSLERS